MGCDGGTIPRRDELVRLKKKPEQKDKDAEMVAKWKHCAISQEPLQEPIVACELGKLYKKDTVIEYLLDKSKVEGNDFDHIRGLKDIKTLNLTDNPDYKKEESDKGDAYVDRHTANYICPVTGLEMSGKYKFVYLWGCGCVFSERAMKEIKTDVCHKCGAAYSSDQVVILNGSDEDVEQMRTNMNDRRAKAKLEKKNKKKHKLEAAEGGPSTSAATSSDIQSKKSKLETGKSSELTNGSAGHKSKLANGSTGSKLGPGATGGKKSKSIQDDPTASKTFKSLFTTSEKGKNQPTAHWVTYNPCYN